MFYVHQQNFIIYRNRFMFEQYQIRIGYRTRERQIINALLALATGVLTLGYPNFLFLIAGGYLLALGILFLIFRVPSVISIIPAIAGLVIMIFPDLIPITFAMFLGFFGLILLFIFRFTVTGALTLLLAILIILNPDSVSYLIAAFLILYGVSNLIHMYQDSRYQDDGPGEGPVSVQG